MLTETFILGESKYMVSGSKDSSDTPQYSTPCPLPWFVKTEDILTSDKWGKVAITWKNDKQMEDKPWISAFALSSMEPEWTRKEVVPLFMLASAISTTEVVYVTLWMLTISWVKKVCVYIQYILLWNMVSCGVLVK